MPFVPLAVAVYLGGVLTILSPCILPVLAFVLASTGRPFARWTGPMLAGLVLAFVTVAAAGGTPAGVPGTNASDGSLHVLALGAATGLLWAACAGPVLGLVVTLAASGAVPGRAAALFAVFGAGAATALATALLARGRALVALRRVGGVDRWARRATDGLALAAVAVIALGWDATLLSRGGVVQTAAAEEAILAHVAPRAKADTARTLAGRAPEPLAATFPAPVRSPGMFLVPTPDLGALPDFAGGTGWLNGTALGLPAGGGTLAAASLRGKVVVVNVWTFACYNCLNALPHVKALAAKYRGQDVVVIGVHTPELARERVPDNVADAVRRLGVTYPVVLDPHYAIWRAFRTEYWPSVYIADRTGPPPLPTLRRGRV